MKSDCASGPKLSYDLFTDYQHYKESTAILVRWLIENGDSACTKDSTLESVKQLMDLVQVVRNKNLTVPSHVLQALKSSIGKRRKITDFFKSMQDEDNRVEDDVTRSHEHFTLTLIDALRELQKDLSKRSSSENPLRAEPPVLQTAKPPNIFELLPTEDVEADEKLESLAVTEDAASGLQALPSSLGPPIQEDKIIEDDHLADIIDVFWVVLELDAICSAVKLLWEQASAGVVPIVLASWVSSAALKGAERWLVATTTRLQITEHQTIIDDCYVRLRRLHFSVESDSESAPEHTPFTAGGGLSTAWFALRDFKYDRQHNERLMKGRLFEKPADHITVQKDVFDGPRQIEAEHVTMDRILKTMKQLLCNGDVFCKSFTLDINPLLVDVKEYLDSDVDSVTTSLVFGMQLLVESFKSFLFCDGAISGINCRTKALKFAQEVKHSLDALIANEDTTGCKCASCGGAELYGILRLFKHELDDYIGQKRFDLYYQTPWVAGQHMQEILSIVTDYGLHLCEQQGTLAIVLHLYNMLVRLKILQDKISLLESLCSSLRDSVFQGSHPSQNYHSHFVRGLGGRLEFKDTSSHHDQAWQLSMPKPVGTGSERRRLVPSQISRFYDIENRRYAIDIDKWFDIYQAKQETKATRKAKDKMNDRIHRNSFAVSLLRLKDYAAPEFFGDYPIARINYFAVHIGCMRVLERIASLEEDRLLTETRLPPSKLGMRFVTDLFRQVDKDQKDNFRGLPYMRSLRRSKEALLEVLQGTSALYDISQCYASHT